MQSRRTTLVVVAVLVLAGCTGSLPGHSDQSTPGDTTTTATPTATTSLDGSTTDTTSRGDGLATTTSAVTTLPARVGEETNASRLPPGLNATGVEDADSLITAHRAALNATGFAYRFQSNVSVGGASQWTVQRGRVEVGLAPLLLRSTSLRRVEGDVTTVETHLWANDSATAVRYLGEDETTHRRYNRTGESVPLTDETLAHLPRADLASQVTNAWLLEFALSTGEFDLSGIERQDGDRVAVLRATEPANDTNVSDLDATVVVDARGRVRNLTLTAAYAGEDATRIHYAFDLVETGQLRVVKPRWVDAARRPGNQTTATPETTATTTTDDVRTLCRRDG